MPRPIATRSCRTFAVASALVLVASAATGQPAPTHDAAATTDASPVTATAQGEMAAYSDSDHVNVVTPSVSGTVTNPTAGWSGSGSYLVDVISAASVDIVSTASSTWHEVRQAGTLEASYKPHTFGAAVTGAVSSEPDYLSLTGGGTLTLDLDEKNYTLLLGYAYGRDVAGRSGTPFSTYSLKLDRHSLSAGLNVVLDRASLLVLVGDVDIESGDQSKPYRYVPMFAPDVAPNVSLGAHIGEVNALRLPERPHEQLPLSRQRYALTARIAHRFAGATARASERVYTDSWGLGASTTDARFLFDIGRFIVGPHLRGHVQRPVSFWQRAYSMVYAPGGQWTIPEYRTGDRELGPLVSLGFGAEATWYLGSKPVDEAWHLGLSVEGSQTFYQDDLYITKRIAGLSSFNFGGEF